MIKAEVLESFSTVEVVQYFTKTLLLGCLISNGMISVMDCSEKRQSREKKNHKRAFTLEKTH